MSKAHTRALDWVTCVSYNVSGLRVRNFDFFSFFVWYVRGKRHDRTGRDKASGEKKMAAGRRRVSEMLISAAAFPSLSLAL